MPCSPSLSAKTAHLINRHLTQRLSTRSRHSSRVSMAGRIRQRRWKKTRGFSTSPLCSNISRRSSIASTFQTSSRNSNRYPSLDPFLSDNPSWDKGWIGAVQARTRHMEAGDEGDRGDGPGGGTGGEGVGGAARAAGSDKRRRRS